MWQKKTIKADTQELTKLKFELLRMLLKLNKDAKLNMSDIIKDIKYDVRIRHNEL